MSEPTEGPQLRREIGLPYATAMVVGTIIGASIFVQPSEITGQVPTVAGVFLVWTICGILTLLGALVAAELASTFDRTGGVYVYLTEAFSPTVGFLWGWAMFWTMHSGIIAAIAVIFARYLGWLVPLGIWGEKAVAVLAILVLTSVNYRGVRQGAALQAAFTAGKLLAIALIILAGFALGGGAAQGAGLTHGGLEVGVGLGDFSLALVAGLFAFGGWHMVTYNAEETVEPRRTIPRSLGWGIAIVTVSYLALNAVYFHVLPFHVVATSDRVAADAADAVLGFGGGAAMSVLVCFSTFGALAGIVLAGPRVYWAMARDGLIFRWMGGIHPRHKTPHRALVAQGAWASVLVLTGTYQDLFTRVVYTEWVFFGLMAVGLILLRRRPDLQRDYRIWGYPVTPLVFALASFGIVANQVAAEPLESVTGLGFVLVGLPVYYLWGRGSKPRSAT